MDVTAALAAIDSALAATDAARAEVAALAGGGPAPPATTTTVLTASPNPATVGLSIALTATVTGRSPSGTVQFKDGQANIGSPLALVAGAVTLTTTLVQGTHSIGATYTGDPANLMSTSPAVSVVVNAAGQQPPGNVTYLYAAGPGLVPPVQTPVVTQLSAQGHVFKFTEFVDPRYGSRLTAIDVPRGAGTYKVVAEKGGILYVQDATNPSNWAKFGGDIWNQVFTPCPAP